MLQSYVKFLDNRLMLMVLLRNSLYLNYFYTQKGGMWLILDRVGHTGLSGERTHTSIFVPRAQWGVFSPDNRARGAVERSRVKKNAGLPRRSRGRVPHSFWPETAFPLPQERDWRVKRIPEVVPAVRTILSAPRGGNRLFSVWKVGAIWYLLLP
jgi:hypothetical protein